MTDTAETTITDTAQGEESPPAPILTAMLKHLHLEHPNFKNPRTHTGMTEKELGELADTIKADGMTIRPEVVKIKADTREGFILLCWDGQRRVKAATKAWGGNTEIEVILTFEDIFDLSDEKVAMDLEDRALTVGKFRAPLSSFELVEVAERRRQKGIKLDEIAKSVRRSPSWVSRMLNAYTAATPKLIASWRKGEITDEQFKELAAEKDKEQQERNAEEVAESRKRGDKTEARTRAKEVVESAKAKRKRERAEAIAKKEAAKRERARAREQAAEDRKAKKRTKGGTQPELTLDAPTPKPKKPAEEAPAARKIVPPTKVALNEMVSLAEKLPPTHDYVKGMMDGTRHALGLIEPHELAKPWMAYINRVGGTANVKATGKSKKPTKERRSKGGKARSGRSRKAKK